MLAEIWVIIIKGVYTQETVVLDFAARFSDSSLCTTLHELNTNEGMPYARLY
jgi:hypothetical protein